ncbi:hypothetical protein BU17DRAFT_54342, partial [Hysterangium stoloniferum]
IKQRGAEVVKQEDEPPSIGDTPLYSDDAAKILDVLEMIDTQGLLDRVFPLPESQSASSSGASTSKDATKMYSLRTLLKHPTAHPLKVLRSAIKPLFPISSQPRSRPSIPAAQQLHFCNIALSLLDQSAQNHPPITLSQTTIFPESENSESSYGLSDKRRRYALAQKLPGGEWWSSANTIREGEQGLSATEAKELHKGHAELVSIIPSLPIPTSSLPTLGDLRMEGRKGVRSKFRPLQMHYRSLSSGTFLDYGPYTSFAPAFDSEGAEVGREGLGQVLMGRIDKRKIKERRRKLMAQLQAEQSVDIDTADTSVKEKSREHDRPVLDDIFSSLFPAQDVDAFKEALQLLQVEEGVAELLQKNASTLNHLNGLQMVRLQSEDQELKVDTEEWKLAQEIMNSLTLLTALRPRFSPSESDASNQPPLIPPASVLRALHATLPSAPAAGWQGTLDETRKTALRDDATVYVKAGASQVSTQPITATPTTPAYATPGYPSGAQYRPPIYPYQNSQTGKRPGTQTPTASQSTYYPNAYLQSGQTAGRTPQYPCSYPQTYGQWFNYQPSTGQKAGATSSYYGSYSAQTSVSRAVGNTAKPQQAQQNGWAQGYGQNQTVATLPAHLRRAGPSTPGRSSPVPQPYAVYHSYVPPTQAQSGR